MSLSKSSETELKRRKDAIEKCIVITYLTNEDDLLLEGPGAVNDGPFISIEPWEPGAFIMELIDYRLQKLKEPSMASETRSANTKEGNLPTGNLYRMLEREILRMWSHAIAKHYDVYGEANSQGVIFKEPVGSGSRACHTCHASLVGPLKHCMRCKKV